MPDSMIEDKHLAKKIQGQVTNLRRLVDAVGDRRIRHHIDDLLCQVFLLAREGHIRNMNGGVGPSHVHKLLAELYSGEVEDSSTTTH